MDVRQLRYFLEIATHSNFNRAAERLRIAQPALSRQMRKLEEELKVPLFMRVGRGIALTPAGVLLVGHARFILGQIEQARDAVIAEATVPQGTAAVGAPPSVGCQLFAPLAERYSAAFPNVTLRLVEGMTHSLLEWLRAGQIDVGMITVPRGPDPEKAFSDLTIAKVIAEDMLIFGPAGDRELAPECALSELRHLPLIVTSRPNMARLIIESAATDRRVQLNVRMEVESLQVMKALVTRGLGYGIAPRIGLHGSSDQFTTSRIQGVKLTRALAHRADRPLSAAVSRLVEHIGARLEELALAGAFLTPSAGRKSRKRVAVANTEPRPSPRAR